MAMSKIKARRKMLQEIEVADKTTSLQYGPPAGEYLSSWAQIPAGEFLAHISCR